MVDGNAVKPRAPRGFPAESPEPPVCAQKDIVCCILGFVGVGKQPKAQVKDGAAVLGVEISEIRRTRRCGLRFGRDMFALHAHNCVHR